MFYFNQKITTFKIKCVLIKLKYKAFKKTCIPDNYFVFFQCDKDPFLCF